MRPRCLPWLVALPLAAAALARAEDPVAELAARIQRGEERLEFRKGPLGYLPALLEKLGIHADSQVLVFSKTSFQAAKISPKAPRAVYFNDNFSVGYVQDGDVLEIFSVTPEEGIVAYTLGVQEVEKPRFDRRTGACNSCHAGGNQGVPGLMATSVFPDRDGAPLFIGSMFPPIDHRSPFEDRWGGWYVTGTHGSQKHRGNAIVPNADRRTEFETEGTQNVSDLSKKVDLSRYLTASSDLVALMTLEHQTAMTNFLVRARVANREELDTIIGEMIPYMLFSGEMPIREPIAGNTTFAQSFAGRGPRDSKGRSLREFDLQKRMFRYPLSYMIYSTAFAGLRAATRERVYRGLYDVLASKTPPKEYAHLTAADRQALIEIVRETRPDLPSFWK